MKLDTAGEDLEEHVDVVYKELLKEFRLLLVLLLLILLAPSVKHFQSRQLVDLLLLIRSGSNLTGPFGRHHLSGHG